MHYRMLVTVSAKATDTSASVRRAAFDRLSQDDSFCGSGGRFGGPLCDWFVLGGRWSGFLTEALLADAFRQAILAQLPGMGAPFIAESYIRENAVTLNRLWTSHGGTGPHPLLRDSYGQLGFEDDARPITQQLLDTVLAPYLGKDQLTDQCHCEFADLDYDALTADAIGTKWVVVVDYHS